MIKLISNNRFVKASVTLHRDGTIVQLGINHVPHSISQLALMS
jgi:hypothetical protein